MPQDGAFGAAIPEAGEGSVAAPIIWKEITTAFKGRMIGGSYAVEGGIVRVRTTLGEKVEVQLGETNAALVAWRLLRELAADGKA